MYSTGPIFDSMGLINAIWSYEQTIAISFTCDREMMPDPEVYAAALQGAFDALYVRATGKPIAIPPNLKTIGIRFSAPD